MIFKIPTSHLAARVAMHVLTFAGLSAGLWVGCNRKPPRAATDVPLTKVRPGNSAGPQAVPPQSRRAGAGRPRRPRSGETRRTASRRNAAAPRHYRPQEAVIRVGQIMAESTDLAPTLIVWIVDVSPSALRWGTATHLEIQRYYADLAGRDPQTAHRLRSAVLTVGAQATTAIEPTAETQPVSDFFANLPADSTGRELTFAAIDKALTQFGTATTEQPDRAIVVIVTDEAGDDWQTVDQLVLDPVRRNIPVYVLGVPAPFGQVSAVVQSGEPSRSANATGPATAVVQGPESRGVERLVLPFTGFGSQIDPIESGYGPFALEWMCRASGGEFLFVQPRQGPTLQAELAPEDWPRARGPQLTLDQRQRYAPDYLTAPVYQQLCQIHPARSALHQAAQLPPAERLGRPVLDFFKRDEAGLKRTLDQAQRAAAKRAPAIDQLYETLAAGAATASQLKRPRWRAAFDLAFGQICAEKARIDGYNAMLASLKRGRAFTNPNSHRWVLVPAPATTTSSALQKLADRARRHLQRVVKEHAGTPWAELAKLELKDPMGWQWTEAE